MICYSFISEYLDTYMSYVTIQLQISWSQLFGEESLRSFSVECRSWHLLSRWILTRGGIHYLSMCREQLLTTPSLLVCSTRRYHRIQVWMLYPPSLHFGVCNSWDHNMVTGTTVYTHWNTHTLSCLHLSFLPQLMSACLLLIHIHLCLGAWALHWCE